MEGREQTQQDRILDAARELLLQYGYDKMTMADIARLAGVSKSAIYLHYSSKETLVDALVLRQMQRLGEDTMMALEQDTSVWSFTGMYANSLKVMAQYPLVEAVTTQSKTIFGRYFHRTTLDFLEIKRQARPDLLYKMQEAGAVRQDLDMEVLSYVMDFMTYGFMKIREVVSDDEAPPLDKVLTMLGGILDDALLPPDGGNREAGRQIILDIVREFRQQMELMRQEED